MKQGNFGVYSNKLKMSLEDVRNSGIFEEIEQPEFVYHMTSRSNAEKIIADRKIKCFNDYMCFFFPSLDCIPVYIFLTGADHGRQYYGTDGRLKTDPPLNHSETVVLKLACKKEPLTWYRETINGSNRTMTENQEKLWSYMNAARICHYGDMKIKTVLDIIELTDIDKLPEPAAIAEIKAIRTELKNGN